MKKITAAVAALLLTVTLVRPAAAVGAGSSVYTNTRQITDNLYYSSIVSYINGGERHESRALSMTGKGDAYPILMADDTIYGSMTIDQAIDYATSQGRNVLAGVNSDFFSMRTGVPMGLVVEDGVYKSSSDENTAVAFMPDGSVYFSENPNVTTTLQNNGGDADTSDKGQTATVTNFNKYRMDTGGLYLYSSAYSTVSTRTSSPGWFVKLKILSGTPTLSGSMSLQVVDTVHTSQEQTIGDGYLVLTAADQCGYAETFAKFKVGDKVTLTTSCADQKLAGAKWVSGCGNILIKNGALTDSANWDNAISSKNPRTAFGVKADGTVLCYVADGSEDSSGLTLQSLAEELLQRGCVQAVNFDGGGSSAISARIPGLADSEIMNHPSDGSPRSCAAYLLFVTDKKPDGAVKRLSLQNDGVILLAGASVNLSYFGIDGGYKPVTAPGDITASSGTGLGTVNGNTYTAGARAGDESLQLSSSSTGAAGTGNIHIVDGPSSLSVTAEGSAAALSSLTVWPGDTLQLYYSASYYGLPMMIDDAALKFSTSAGAVSAGGLFTAGTLAGQTGAVNLTIGNTTASVPITVTGFNDTASHWAKPYIRGLVNMGVVSGTSPTTFSPDTEIHRGDFVLMLYRAAGKPAVTGTSSFTDVAPSDYYATAITWAEQNKIALGNGSGLFNPKATLTREQAFALAYRALGALQIKAPDGSTDLLGRFSDRSLLSSYAVAPTAALVGMGVVSGSGGTLKPANPMTRGEMAKILLVIIGYGVQEA